MAGGCIFFFLTFSSFHLFCFRLSCALILNYCLMQVESVLFQLG